MQPTRAWARGSASRTPMRPTASQFLPPGQRAPFSPLRGLSLSGLTPNASATSKLVKPCKVSRTAHANRLAAHVGPPRDCNKGTGPPCQPPTYVNTGPTLPSVCRPREVCLAQQPSALTVRAMLLQGVQPILGRPNQRAAGMSRPQQGRAAGPRPQLARVGPHLRRRAARMPASPVPSSASDAGSGTFGTGWSSKAMLTEPFPVPAPARNN